MKKLKLIYNPFSGDRNFVYDIDEAITVFQQVEYETHVFRSIQTGDTEQHISQMEHSYYDVAAVSGGYGTLRTCGQ